MFKILPKASLITRDIVLFISPAPLSPQVQEKDKYRRNGSSEWLKRHREERSAIALEPA
jgi:hypothetical protein